MRKTVIALAAVAMAAVVNAAQCLWTGIGVQKVNTADMATTYTMYLLDASVTDSATMSGYLANGDLSYLSAATVTTTAGIEANGKVRWTSTFGAYTTGNEYTYYTVIFNGAAADADYYMVTKELTLKVPAVGNMSMTFGTQANNAWTAVPEPTSGLLALLGFAGLALRRRRG